MKKRLALAAPLLLIGAVPLAPSPAGGQSNPPPFKITLTGNEGINRSSIVIGDVDGDQQADDIVVGGRDGVVHAYRGNGTLIFEFDIGAFFGISVAGIESRAAIGDVDADGFPEVVVTAGSGVDPGAGRLVVLSHTGAHQCNVVPLDTIPDGLPDGIFTSPALADLDGNDSGKLEIVFGAWDHQLRAIHDNCTALWTLGARDTIYSSPAIGDLDGDGDLDVVTGVDSHLEGPPFNTTDGGRLFAVDGATGASLPGFPKQYDEVIASTPALGDLDGDGDLDIVVGTGNCWGSGNPACGNPQHPGVGEYILAVDRTGTALPGWPRAIPGHIASGSPAIADVDGNGDLEVVINGFERSSGTGKLWVLEHTGTIRAGFPKTPVTPADCNAGTVGFATNASPILADIDDDGDLDVVLASNGELVIYDASTGTQLSRQRYDPPACSLFPAGSLVFATASTVDGTAAVGDIDDDGLLELVVGGYDTSAQITGAIHIWDLATSAATTPPWPMFKRNAAGHSLYRDSLFADGFEGGDTSAWSSSFPP